MKRHDDIKELIREQAAGPAEARDLEAVTAAVELELVAPVRPRPGFKPELRARLMEAARRELPAAADAGAMPPEPVRPTGLRAVPEPMPLPSRRARPAAPGHSWWRTAGWSAAAAAAAAVAMFTLLPRDQMSPLPTGAPPQAAPALPAQPEVGALETGGPAQPRAPQPAAPYSPGTVRSASPYTVAHLSRSLPHPELQVAGAGAQVPAGISAATGPARVTWRPAPAPDLPTAANVYELLPPDDLERLAREAARSLELPAPQPGNTAGVAFTSVGAAARLTVRTSGVLEYAAQPAPAGPPATAAQAQAAARTVLRSLGANSATAQPVVVQSPHQTAGAGWGLHFHATADDAPVLGAPDVVNLSPSGQLLFARVQPALLQFLDTVPLKDVAAAADSLNGTPVAGGGQVTLTGARLVFGRPEAAPAGGALVAQPFYEFTGTTAEGWAYVGYVPAVAGAPAPER